MKWKPISTLGDEESTILARISYGCIEQISWCNSAYPSHCHGRWTHWCEQPEIPHPAESWPVDKKVFVSESEGSNLFKRHFKEYKNGKFYVFDNGRSSFTSDNVHAVSSFTYARLAKDGE